MSGRELSKQHNKSWLDDLLSKDNASRCRRASIPLYKDCLVVSLINQVGRICASIMFSLSFLIAGWLVMVGGAAI